MPESTNGGAEIGSLERAVGERRGIDLAQDAGAPADPELVERARRRRFSAEYKLRILREADACSKPGEIGALLRREGLYSSLLTEWRRQRERGSLAALDRPRGRPKSDPREAQIAALQRRLERAEVELEKARRVIEVQGNVSALLGDLLEPRGAQGSTER
jgi:transposase-like protein